MFVGSFPAMDTLASRLIEARTSKGYTQQQLAERVGMSQQGIQSIEEGKSKHPRKLLEIARAVGKSPEWLLGKAPAEEYGSNSKGSFFTPKIVVDAIVKAIPEIDIRAGASYGGGMIDEEYNIELSDGQVINGHPAIAQWGFPPAYVEKELGLSYGQADIIRVRGDSMDDGTAKALVDGDRVIIDRQDTDPRQGGVFAVFDGGGVIIKQVELQRGSAPPQIVCKSRNTLFDPIHLTLDGNVHIIGRVAGKISRL